MNFRTSKLCIGAGMKPTFAAAFRSFNPEPGTDRKVGPPAFLEEFTSFGRNAHADQPAVGARLRLNEGFVSVAFLCCLALAATVLIETAAAGADVNSDAIAKVKAGELEEAKASWWGFDPADSTRTLQAAISSGAKRVIVENMGTPWIVTPIHVANDQEIIFEKDTVVEAKKGEFKGGNDSLFNIVLKKNVSLVGDGAVLRMQRKDYDNPPYKKAEWRHVVNIKSSSNIRILGLTLAESGGDGIYLGTAKRGVTNKDILIKDVVCDGNYRQGISVITAENLLIEDTIMKNTAGTAPQAGIDFEPNHSSERLVNCLMRNCIAENNVGCGYAFYLPHLDAKSAPLTIRFENCVARGTNRSAFVFTAGNDGPDAGVRGLAEFIDCTFADGAGPAIAISRKPAAGCRLRFAKCRLVHPAKGKPAIPAIQIGTRQGNTEDVGGVAFEDCLLEDSVQRPIMKYVDQEGGLRLVDVTGTLRVRCAGSEALHTFTDEWLKTLHVGNIYKRFPRYETKGVRFEPLSADVSSTELKLRPFSLRRAGVFVLHARRGDQVAFALRHLQVGKYSGQPMRVTVLTPSGKKLPLGDAAFQDETTLQFEAPETGLHRIPFDCGANKVQMTASNRPVCVSGESGRIKLIGATGDFWFYVPAGTKEFGVKIAGEGEAEAVAATLFDPAGQKLWEKPTITAPEQFVLAPNASQTGKAWRITFARPAGTTMEDYYVELQGIPPFLSCTPKALLKPTD